MPSLDSLPGDQRAVLQLVLGRGRSYDEIARLLSIKSSAVRERAQVALDTLGPHTDVSPEEQQRVADYLLGQLSDADAQEVRDLLVDSPSARAWARVVASELAPLAGDSPMPEIPVERSAPREASEPVPAPPRTSEPPPAETVPAAGVAGEPERSGPDLGQAEPEQKARRRRRRRGAAEEAPVGAPRSSRLGGALVILLVLVAVGVGLFFVLRGGHSKSHGTSTSSTTAAPAASATTPTSTTSTSSSSTSASVVAQINLTPPASAKSSSKTAGIAEVLNEGSTDGVAIVAQNVPPNKTKPPNAYAVWLYNSPKDAKILGFVNPGVGKTGRLSTAGGLPSNASHYKQLIVTVETTASPKTPGTIILQGNLTRL
jgi:hypothetical protein